MKRRKILTVFLIILSLILSVLSILNAYLIVKYDVLPIKYLIIFLIVVVLVPTLLILNNFKIKHKRRKKFKIFTIVVEILYILALSISLFYLSKTFSFLDSFAKNFGYDVKNYYVISLSNSDLNEIDDLNNKTIGYVKDDDSFDKAIEELKKVISPELKILNNIGDLFKELDDKTIDAIIMLDSYYDLYFENDEEKTSKVIYKFTIKEKIKVDKVNFDVSNEPFSIYISGMDDYGKISEKSRSDVNIVISINPQSYEILLINIPRDYYVTLPSFNKKDKLTHAGIYGIKESVGTLENLLDTKIDYYFKVNYSALVELVDAIDGVNVYSEYDFNTVGTGHNYHFNKGYNYVDGAHALEFSRTREAFTFGDRIRGENQQRMIKAIIDKMTGSTVLLRKYGKILDSLEGTFLTNISTNEITDLVKLQLDKKPSWNISSISLNGSDAHEYTYSYASQPLYVMIPDENTVRTAKETIKKLISGEKIVIEGDN